MSDNQSGKCPTCGATLLDGGTRCPNGHTEAPSEFSTVQYLQESSLEEGSVSFESVVETAKVFLADSLFECRRCERLLEAHTFLGRLTTPSFCPWCGKAVDSLFGRELDGYRIEKVLARGGFGTVFLASNLAQPRMQAVVKILRPEMIHRRPELIKIFVEEARLTEEIGQTCWNIVRVFNVRERPWPYFFMEYIRGTTLDRLLRESFAEPIRLEECKGYLRGIAKALAATHSHVRVHRDLKPANIMVITGREISEPEEKIKLLDFGLAMKIARKKVRRAGASEDHSGLSDSDSPVQSGGTPEYMPGEAFDGIHDFSADIYSFGATAYEVLTGRRPWDSPAPGTDRFSYWRDTHKKVPPRPIREVRPDVPKWLARVVMQCLEKEPTKRIRDSEQLLRRLRDPLPLWVWLSSAAALFLVAWLGLFALTKEENLPVREWRLVGSDVSFNRNPLELWVKDEIELSRILLHAALGDKHRIVECEALEDGVECEPLEDGRARVAFPPRSELLGGTVEIVGEGDGFTFSGEIRIRGDNTLPEVGPLLYVAGSGPPRPVLTGQSYQQDNEFRVESTEEHPADVTLYLKYLKRLNERVGQTLEVKSKLASESGSQTWSFELPLVDEGYYDAWVEVRDQAGNQGRSPVKSFYLDDSVAVDLDQEREYFIPGHVFLPFDANEGLGTIAWHIKGSETWLDARVYLRGDMDSSLKLNERINQLEAASELKEGKKYFLAIPWDHIQESATLEISIKDNTIPPNGHLVEREVRVPPPLLREDLKVSLQVDEQSPPMKLEVERLLSNSDTPGSRPTVFILSPRLAALTVEFPREQVLRASYSLGERTGIPPDSHTQERVVFGDLDLAADVENEIHLEFAGPVGEPLELTVPIYPDTAKPKLEIHLLAGDVVDPPYHSLTDSDAIEVRVTSGELLSDVVANTPEFQEYSGVPVGGGTGSVAKSYLVRVPLDAAVVEGPFPLEIAAHDLAGNKTKTNKPFVVELNAGAPRFHPLLDDDAGTLRLRSDQFLFDLEDGNGVDYSVAGIEFAFDDPRTGASQRIVLPVEEPARGEKTITLGLEQLPPACKGTLRPRFRDRFGIMTTEVYEFTFRRPEKQWRERVKWRGVDWVLVDTGGTRFYISRCEVSNRLFYAKELFDDGLYKDPVLAETYPRPKYWGARCEFPSYERIEGARVPGDDFPVVGISPDEAETFARLAFSARLPTWEEWRSAATVGNPEGEWPWKDVRAGLDYFNHRLCHQTRPNSKFATHFYTRMHCADGESYSYSPVEVDFDPFPTDVKREPENKFVQLLHMIGNVGELVRFENKGGGFAYGIAGGHFRTQAHEAKLGKVPKSYSDTYRNASTGFRMVIPVADAHVDFEAVALEK